MLLDDFTELLDSTGALGTRETSEAFDALLSGKASEASIIRFLTTLNRHGVTSDELVGGAKALRERATPVARPADGPFAGAKMIDTCGTGGAPKLFNVSTLVAIIVPSASGGSLMVAKHGNVSRTGRGSAEVLETLGVNIRAAAETQTRCLAEIGLCFCLAPAHHPTARHVAAARKAIGVPTIFNLLGPLANPAGAQSQIIGTWSLKNAELLAHALHRLGADRSWVHTSQDGLDEFTRSAPNIVFEIASGVERHRIDCPSFGLAHLTIDQMQVANLPSAAAAVRSVLAGEVSAFREMTVWSAAAALTACGHSPSLESGMQSATEAIDRGLARRTLERLIELSNG